MRHGLAVLTLIALSALTASAAFARPAVTAAAAGPAAMDTVYGVAEDATKYADDGGASLYPLMRNAGLGVTRWTIRPESTDEAFVARALPVAVANGIRVVASVHTERPANDHDPAAFCAWLEGFARRFPAIKDYIIWNEPNTRLFWQPQKDEASGAIVSAAAYMELLKRCHAALKGVSPSIQVIAFGLSPRASTPASSAPIPWLRAAGEAWRAMGGGPLPFDAVAVHPYPNPNSASDAPEVGYADPNNFGIPNLDRVKNAMREAFGRVTKIIVDEVAWQVDTAALGGYSGTENVKVVDEPTQAEYLTRMIQKYFACDPDVAMVLMFHLIDEPQRDGRDPNTQAFVGGGWQSGLFDVSLRARAAVAAVKAAIDGGCKGGGGPSSSPDEEFAELKESLEREIAKLQRRVKKLAKQGKLTSAQAAKFRKVLARLEDSLETKRFAAQTVALENSLKKIDKQLAAANKKKSKTKRGKKG